MMPAAPTYHPWLPFWTLLRKEVLRFLGISMQSILAPVVSASLYLLVFGVSLGSRVSDLEGVSYLNFVVPGLIMMTVINNSFSNSSFSLFMQRYLGSIVDLIVTPITPLQWISALTIASMLRGLVVGMVVFGISLFFTHTPWVDPVKAFFFLGLASFLFSQLGIVAGLYSSSFDSLSVYANFILTPLIYLGGMFYPIHQLPSPWNQISRLNPIHYLIDGFRSSTLGLGESHLVVSLSVTVAISTILFTVSYQLLKRGHRICN